MAGFLTAQRTSSRHVVAALLGRKATGAANAAGPSALPSVTKGGNMKGSPHRDKSPIFNSGVCLQEQDQLQVLKMVEDASNRFSVSMEDIHPDSFTGEAMRIDRNSLGLRGGTMQELGLASIERSTQSIFFYQQRWSCARRMKQATTRTLGNAGTTGHSTRRQPWIDTHSREKRISSTRWGGQLFYPSWT